MTSPLPKGFFDEFGPLRDAAVAESVRLDADDNQDGGIEIWIEVTDLAKRGRGLATRYLVSLLDLIDRWHLPATLVASASGPHPDNDELADWYEKYGFLRTSPTSRTGGIKMNRPAR